ncbi:MAG: 30S ribosomal protein S9 [Candidatus Marinimicrobia bacterium]|nr:30S ribosomal protein S9 [Candidatus Neomarinimicrobiota bacterium]
MVKKKTKRGRKKAYLFAVGRRKTAHARVRLFKGKGNILVNGQPIEKYFPGKANQVIYTQPFKVTDAEGKYYATIKVEGSGKNGQLGAVVHGLARALGKENLEVYRAPLKKAGLLTRDPRMKERRKAGLAQSARAKKQSPKR